MSHTDPIDVLLEAVDPADRGPLGSLAVPVAGGTAGQRVPAPTSSYVGGHPFLPAGHQWPVDDRGQPMHFVTQVAFAEVPRLDGFPTEGLLQMFVESTDTWGLTFDDTMGLTGFHCRWFDAADLAAGSVAAPDAPVPAPRDAHSPVIDPTTPRSIEFTLARMLPDGGEQLTDHVAAAPHGFDALTRAWDDHEDLADATVDGWDVQVGGWPSFVQAAPAVPGGRGSRLLLGLGSLGAMMWGDVGTAHLFGDPAGLAAGDLSGLWWEWACS